MLVWPAPMFLISHLQIKILGPSKADKLPSAQLAACCTRGVRRPWQGHGSARKSQGGRQARPGKACTCHWASLSALGHGSHFPGVAAEESHSDSGLAVLR